jgi:hypothetical protein
VNLTHLDIDLDTSNVEVTADEFDLLIEVEAPGMDIGLPGPQGTPGPAGPAGADSTVPGPP